MSNLNLKSSTHDTLEDRVQKGAKNNMHLRYRCLSAITLGACILAVGCQPNNSANQVLNVYSARHYDTDEAIYDAFTEKTGVKIQLVEGKDDELIERLKAEGENTVFGTKSGFK